MNSVLADGVTPPPFCWTWGWSWAEFINGLDVGRFPSQAPFRDVDFRPTWQEFEADGRVYTRDGWHEG